MNSTNCYGRLVINPKYLTDKDGQNDTSNNLIENTLQDNLTNNDEMELGTVIVECPIIEVLSTCNITLSPVSVITNELNHMST